MAAWNNGITVVFDFDKTIIDVDSDNWVVDALGATHDFDCLLSTMPWNTAIDAIMGELHARGRTLRDVADVLRAVPLDPRIVAAIKACHALGCDLRILSDANRFFIDAVLDHHGLRAYFSDVTTNPSHVDADGRLRIAPHHDFHAAPHGCCLGTCPPNMCKGQALDRNVRGSSCAAGGGKMQRFIYLGDGRGDYCPSLRLGREDMVMPRKGFPVWDLICEDPARLQAEVHPWSNGAEMEETLLRLVARVLIEEEESQLPMPLDCKLQLLPAAVQDGLPMPALLRINH